MLTEITNQQIKDFRTATDDKHNNIIRRAVTKNGIHSASFDQEIANINTPIFSIDLDTGKVANQKQSGRCWMFAALNTMRHDIKDRFHISDEFQLSQSYTLFWDKFEKANYFYENVLKTATEPLDSRRVSFLLTTPQQDGGQWDMIVSIIEKYGLVPQSIYPESKASSATAELNNTLNTLLRHDATVLRGLVAQQASKDKISNARNEMLANVYRLLSLTLGEPPVQFDFEYRDELHNFHVERQLTPQDYYQKFVSWDLDEYISVINAPTADKPFDATYNVDMLGNVVGGRDVKHLNVDINKMKAFAISQLKDGQSVWFGVDMGPQVDRESGLMASGIFASDDLFNVDSTMTKAQRLDYGESLMTHAMVLTGVDLDENDQPTKWKVENSWGEKVGKKGYFTMSDDWMSEYAYQIVVKKEYLSSELVNIYDNSKPTLLSPWDPMGALA
ncbi:C1 family peptidase [Leuconostoc mesenteroides]|uniref:Aminopeptidase n=1 Tax=Leuconostoc mesenteroides subsp. mesenteroides (strain ATCC 8293 / DSM 20343 / BCRC 11652 / CCM 1803 / JCM 6124 / NCDO 523 / NBRC 100496 / NCIMB 8023 / NCTC 12954 / NRRL B-1118 / 37Y) TaxID=203120 RepID=Q03VC5_LEUMM|nr:C1 family peptidase [Leuconostoc mesenteroides]ABJ62847.1 aminopeptidase C, Cysteine peptidase, MEROPS family C01B [Leuconostoc mesenteroides subsp. mesenteroides ATCC 8293]MCT3043266.1 aminopeptidase [Leuconostoc mesenteroides]MDG9746610.1 C1 family peptidase [Leuconostoc mesenteroides]QHM55328.1 Aminopeptidase C [Leuconostoc mesenteroides]QQB30396.1 C1 family peptidase [Leuconostoc mesenteroides]